MHISPSLIGKIIGAVAVIAICIPLFLWSRANYSIEGTIQVDTGAYINPARNIEVRLIHGSVMKEMETLIADYKNYNSFIKDSIAEILLTNLLDKSTGQGGKGTTDLIKEMMSGTSGNTNQMQKSLADLLLSKPDAAETEEVNALVSTYYYNANYCRDDQEFCPNGSTFYGKAAEFWDNKAENLKKYKRLAANDATKNYETTWIDSGGLGSEPVQVVKSFIKTDINLTKIDGSGKDKSETAVSDKKEKLSPGQLIPGSNITTNDIIAAAAELKRDLQQKYQSVLKKSNELLIQMILDQINTDEEGRYIFKGNAVRPGDFYISSKYDILSSEGERVEFSWFEPVTISLKRLAFNKSTIVNLDELNQSVPPVYNIYIPTRDELYIDIVDMLKAKTNNAEKQATAEMTADTNETDKTELQETNSLITPEIIDLIKTN